MFRNYIRTAISNLSRHKGHAILNILGLAIGIAVCLLIFLVIRFETSFDGFHRQKDHIYRVVSAFKTTEGIDYESGVPFPTASTLRMDYPELTNVASIVSLGGGQVSILDSINEMHSLQKFREENGVLYAEPQFFSMFDFEWLAGDKKTALKEPNTVILTRPMADKYFGSWQNAVGRYIKLDNGLIFKISGILNDIPANTDFPLKVVMSYATLKNTGLNTLFSDWASIFAQHYCFVALPDNLSVSQFNKDLANVVEKYKPLENRNEGMMLLPLKEMHFDTRFSTFQNHVFSRDLILALGLIGLFVLVIACANFINLATAQAVNRSKEVGIRKALGGTRRQLLTQFLSEAAMLILFSALVALGITILTLPFFNGLLGLSIDKALITDPSVIGVILAIVIVTTLLAGFYPALVLSGFNPVTALKNKAVTQGSGSISLRRVLIVLQFTISQALIIGVIIVAGQMNYFKSAPLGFDKDAVVITHIPGDSIGISKIENLRARLKQVTGIDHVSFSYASPVDENNWNSDIAFNNVRKHDFGANLKWADADYPVTYGLKLMSGRFYSQSDTIKDLVVNEAFLRKLGIRDPREIIGAKLAVGDYKPGIITGVVKDFNIASLHDDIPPVVMGTWKGTYQTVNIRIQSSKAAQVLASVAQMWREFFPEQVYEYRFLDERIAGYYRQEEQLSSLYKIFAGIAIFISCLGLYSLVSFMAVQRTKEVAIRKTLGASIGNIVYLFSKEFSVLILIAFFLSAPVAWYFMEQWLRNYAFHIQPGPGVFLLAILLSMVIAWISVGYKAIKAATANPVKGLQAE